MLTKIAPNLYVDLDRVSLVGRSENAKGESINDVVVDGFRFTTSDAFYETIITKLAERKSIEE